ncbi:uncharacterized protein B0H18DRAFT_542593 [Fomitopsis serialis]|uniref:uncharacterized protein n=1 Tax=Fomitopsis serialis TaxID=139415 RepID=UPI0020082C6E|nr:uncharacterized protein B0H18DRAFT_542593 [Neoantrodia serialis]KAH9921633.1 hypothetical protein B0H18DRAFT_542593 [Neoantrodia serialis]
MRDNPVSHPFDESIDADTLIRSSDGIIFHVSRAFVGFSSRVLRKKLSDKESTAPDTPSSGDLMGSPSRSLDLPESGRILVLLLQLCYPMPDPEIEDGLDGSDDKLRITRRLLQAATKYEVARAIEFAKRTCIALQSVHPVRVYLLASCYGWDDVAKETARRSVYDAPDSYVPEMEIAFAVAYRRLLTYHQKCRDIILARVDTFNGMPAARSTYWSKTSWLNEQSVVAFWSSVHQRLHENVAAGHGPRLDARTLFPDPLNRSQFLLMMDGTREVPMTLVAAIYV